MIITRQLLTATITLKWNKWTNISLLRKVSCWKRDHLHLSVHIGFPGFKVRYGKVWGYYFSFTTVTDLVLGSKCGCEFQITPQYFAILVVRNKFCWFSISPCPVCEEGRSENVSAKVEKITLNFKFNFQLRTVSGQVKHSFSIAYFQFHLKHFAKEWFNVTFHPTGDQFLTV